MITLEKLVKVTITPDLSKQQKLGAVPNAIQQINFTGILKRTDVFVFATMFLIIEEVKETTRNT